MYACIGAQAAEPMFCVRSAMKQSHVLCRGLMMAQARVAQRGDARRMITMTIMIMMVIMMVIMMIKRGAAWPRALCLTRWYAHTHTYTQTHTHSYVQYHLHSISYILILHPTFTHSITLSLSSTHKETRTHTHTHTHAPHTHMHTHIHTHVHTQDDSGQINIDVVRADMRIGWAVVQVPVRNCVEGTMQLNVRVLCPPVVVRCGNGDASVSGGSCTEVWPGSVSADELGEWVACSEWADNGTAAVHVAELGSASVTSEGVNVTVEAGTVLHVRANVSWTRPLTSFGVRVQATAVHVRVASEATVQVSTQPARGLSACVCLCVCLSRLLDGLQVCPVLSMCAANEESGVSFVVRGRETRGACVHRR